MTAPLLSSEFSRAVEKDIALPSFDLNHFLPGYDKVKGGDIPQLTGYMQLQRPSLSFIFHYSGSQYFDHDHGIWSVSNLSHRIFCLFSLNKCQIWCESLVVRDPLQRQRLHLFT